MAIEGILSRVPSQLPEVTPAGPAARPGTASFADALGQALGQVEALQQAGDAQAESAALGQGNLHEMVMALEKADVSMRVAAKVRTKLVDAYQEIMRMPV
jgi:flagellar hook-basal body complex protein FliE